MSSRRTVLIAALAAGLAAGLASAAAQAPAEPAPPTALTPAAVNAWATGWGMKVGRFNLIAITGEGVFYGNQTVVPRDRSADPAAGAKVFVPLRFERFAPAVNAEGKTFRSEVAELEINCGREPRIRLNGAPRAYVGHGLSGGAAGRSDVKLWTRFAPGGLQMAPPSVDAAGIFRGACNAAILGR